MRGICCRTECGVEEDVKDYCRFLSGGSGGMAMGAEKRTMGGRNVLGAERSSGGGMFAEEG